jgi:hypothetical protein
LDSTHPALQPPVNASELAYLRVAFTHPRQLVGCFLALWGQRTTPDTHHPIYPVFQSEPPVDGWAMLVHLLRVYHPDRPAYGEIVWDVRHGPQYAIRCSGTFVRRDDVTHVNAWLRVSQQAVQRGRPPGGRFQNPQEFLDVIREVARHYPPDEPLKAISIARELMGTYLMTDNIDNAVRMLRAYRQKFGFQHWSDVDKAVRQP